MLSGIFAAQCIIFWTAGIKLWLVLRKDDRTTTAGANAIVLVVSIVAVAVFSESTLR